MVKGAQVTPGWAKLSMAMLLAAGCDDSGGLSALRPVIEVDPEAGTVLEYDQVVLGVSGPAAPRVVSVSNRGDSLLQILEARVEGEHADQFRVSSFPSDLPPGAAGELYVRFEPTVTGTSAAELVLESNDLSRPTLRWPLQGPARDPCRVSIQPLQQKFEFGEVRSVEIRASTSHPCWVTDLETDAALFRFVDPPALPFLVRPGEARRVDIEHWATTNLPGRPLRELWVRESEGTERIATLEGQEPLFNCLRITPDQLLFGSVPIGQTPRRSIRVRNICGEEARIAAANVASGWNAYSVVGEFPVTLPPRGELDIPVEYRPLLPVGDPGRLFVITNDASRPRVEVRMFGEALLPGLEVFPRKVDFGAVAYRNPEGDLSRSECSSAGRTIQIYSTSRADLTISRLALDGPDGLFQISSALVDGNPVDFGQPIVLQQGQEMRIGLIFTPTRERPSAHEGSLRIEHDAPSGVTLVQLAGQGVPDEVAEEVFVQPDGPQADILWVIDDSCSMFDSQARLISNLSTFVTYADGLDSNYRMAVTTTDHLSSRAGTFRRCFPHPHVVGTGYGDQATREAAFRCMFDVGIMGPGDEGGLGAAKSAIEKALDPDLSPNPNFGFLRPLAELVMIVISDEDDGTRLSLPVLRDFYRSLKRRPEQVTMHAIAYPTTTLEFCEDKLFGQSGTRYEWMARELGGRFLNICREDWDAILQDLGLDIFTPITEWDLPRQADASTIVVTIDGRPIPEDNDNGWTYDFGANSVEFHGTARPGPGAEIRIRYQGLCRP